jgi:hypothetical protein
MATLSRLAFAFGAPAIVMAAAVGVVWLSMSRFDPGLGPSRPVLFTPAPVSAPTSGIANLDATSPPPNIDEAAPAWQAQVRNAMIPFSGAALLNPARFSAAADPETPAKALQCLTSAVYYEAANEPDAGKRAVAQVVVNRWANRAFPKTICGVIDQGAPAPGCQFSFMCDGALARRPSPTGWRDAEAIARAALKGYVETSVGAATHYHADYVVPVWAATMLKLTKLGRHIFYRWPGAAADIAARTGEPAASPQTTVSQVSSGASAPPPAPSPPPPQTAPQSVRSPASEDAPRRQGASPAPAAAPPPQAPAAAPLVAPALPFKPRPEPPRRPVPPPSLRVGPV